jgi:hypothetical protein
MDYVIAVRTYNRAAMFQTHTLQLIREQGLLDRLYVFVGSDIAPYSALHPGRYIQVPVGGHNAIRAICEYFPRGQPIFFLDDDLKDYRCWDASAQMFRTDNLDAIIQMGFHASRDPFSFGFMRNKLWLARSPSIRKNYGSMSGSAFGAINEPELISTSHAHLDDTLRAIQYLRLGRVPLTLPGCSFTTAYAKTDGGMQSSGDRANTLQVCEEVREQVAGWCSAIVQQPCGLFAWKWLPHTSIRKRVKAIIDP